MKPNFKSKRYFEKMGITDSQEFEKEARKKLTDEYDISPKHIYGLNINQLVEKLIEVEENTIEGQ